MPATQNPRHLLGRRKDSNHSRPYWRDKYKAPGMVHNPPVNQKLDSGAMMSSVSLLQHMQALTLQLSYDNIRISFTNRQSSRPFRSTLCHVVLPNIPSSSLNHHSKQLALFRTTAMLPVCYASAHSCTLIDVSARLASCYLFYSSQILVSDQHNGLLFGLDRTIAIQRVS